MGKEYEIKEGMKYRYRRKSGIRVECTKDAIPS
jgi:hypothetical protein